MIRRLLFLVASGVTLGFTACSTPKQVAPPPSAAVKMEAAERQVQASQGIPGTNNENSPL